MRSLVRARSAWFTAHGPRQSSGGTVLAGAGCRCGGADHAIGQHLFEPADGLARSIDATADPRVLVDAMVDLNGLGSAADIHPGDVLVVPRRYRSRSDTPSQALREGMTCGDGHGAKTSPIPVAQMDAETYGYP